MCKVFETRGHAMKASAIKVGTTPPQSDTYLQEERTPWEREAAAKRPDPSGGLWRKTERNP